MPNVLDLQGMPDDLQKAASAVLAGGSCVSVISYVGGSAAFTGDGGDTKKIMAGQSNQGAAPLGGSCVSVISYVGSGSGIV